MVHRWIILVLSVVGVMGAPMLSAVGVESASPTATVQAASSDDGCCGEDCRCCRAAHPAQRTEVPACPCSPGTPAAPERAPAAPAMTLSTRAGVVARRASVRPTAVWTSLIADTGAGAAFALQVWSSAPLRDAPWRPTRAVLCIWTT